MSRISNSQTSKVERFCCIMSGLEKELSLWDLGDKSSDSAHAGNIIQIELGEGVVGLPLTRYKEKVVQLSDL